MKQLFIVPDISCEHCKMRIETALNASGAASDWTVDIKAKTVVIESQAARATLAKILSDIGYEPKAD